MAQDCWIGKVEFKNRVKHFAQEIGVNVRAVTLRDMRNKWASCSTSGNLHFNTELLGMDKKIGEYVIVHELLHFHAPNHGKLWKSLMVAYLGDYKKIEEGLRSGQQGKA